MEQLTSGQIEEKINNGEDFILKMYTVWCGPCKQLTEELKKITTNVPIYEFDVVDMPVTVAVDSTGTSVHTTGPKEWSAKIAGIPVVIA